MAQPAVAIFLTMQVIAATAPPIGFWMALILDLTVTQTTQMLKWVRSSYSPDFPALTTHRTWPDISSVTASANRSNDFIQPEFCAGFLIPFLFAEGISVLFQRRATRDADPSRLTFRLILPGCIIPAKALPTTVWHSNVYVYHTSGEVGYGSEYPQIKTMSGVPVHKMGSGSHTNHCQRNGSAGLMLLITSGPTS